jgi:glycerophosphoryl diester phosphodiesterase
MAVPPWLESLFLRSADRICAKLPQPMPPPERLWHCKIVSHRGHHDNRIIMENTLPAFDAILDNGIWGIEFDVRWTADFTPVVFHDRDCRRLFHSNQEIGKLTFKELQTRFPGIPALAQVIQRYGKKLHLMMEIKEEHYPAPIRQKEILRRLLVPLDPQVDFHLLALNPVMFQFFDFLPPRSFLPIAQFNLRKLSDLALRNQYGGINGHFFFVTRSLIKKHDAHAQKVGTGFVASQECLWRELNRGVEWIFSNHAVSLQSICNAYLRRKTR